MLRKLGIIGLAVPLLAVVGALIYLFAFGTDAPTFDAGARELARDHTVIRLSEEPDVALVLPEVPPPSLTTVVILADDRRHIWTVVQDLGLLDEVEPHALALLIAPGIIDSEALKALALQVEEYAPSHLSALVGFAGAPIAALCDDWANVVIVGATPNRCSSATFVDAGDQLGARIVDALQAMRPDEAAE